VIVIKHQFSQLFSLWFEPTKDPTHRFLGVLVIVV